MSLPRLGADDEAPDVDAEIAFMADALRSPLPPQKDLLMVSVPAPWDALEKFLRLVPREMGFLWRSPSGVKMAGGGDTITVRAHGRDRVASLREQAEAIWPRIKCMAMPGMEVRPVMFGGFAFAPFVAPIEPWTEFAEDMFTLPRWMYRRTGDASVLTLCLTATELRDRETVSGALQDLRRILTSLEMEAPTSLIERPEIPRSAVHHISEGEWTTYIDAILSAIRSGEYDKIVAARRCVVDLSRGLEDTGFIARLSAAYPDCTHFAVRRSEATFLGATPETLFRKTGMRLETHALAGTAHVDDRVTDASVEADALRQSSKDLAEHALVVQRIHDELSPLSRSVEHRAEPDARRVRNLVHLQTPIHAELRASTHAFDLLAALHPTPAVGGFPAREAADWILQNEPLERGWYTGTLGWIDAGGDAEFAVAIRCGVMTPRRAYIFAGAGIVERSNPRSEYLETRGKMAPILRALGVAL